MPPSFHKKLFRLSTADGCACAMMLGLGETFFPALLIATSGSSVGAGLVVTLPLFLASCLQIGLFTLKVYFPTRRIFTTFFATLQALALLVLSLALYQRAGTAFLIFLLATVYWAFGQSAGPIWNAWLSKLVAEDKRLRFFSNREKWCQFSTAISLLTGGILLSRMEFLGLRAFAVLFLIAAVFRLISARLLFSHPEDGERLSEIPKVNPSASFGKWVIKNKNIFLFLFLFKSACFAASPFFNPYMLKELKLDYLEYTHLLGVSLFSRVMFMHFAERLAKKIGITKMLVLAGMAISVVPILWVLSASLIFLSMLQVVGGAGWACFDFCVLIYFMNNIEHGARSKVLVGVNFFYSFAALTGSLMGARVLSFLGDTSHGYLYLFAGSTVLRFGALLLIPAFLDRDLKIVEIPMRIIALRPAFGAIMRPVLPQSTVDYLRKHLPPREH